MLPTLRDRLITWAHTIPATSHHRKNQMYHLLWAKYWWLNIISHVHRLISSCSSYTQAKAPGPLELEDLCLYPNHSAPGLTLQLPASQVFSHLTVSNFSGARLRFCWNLFLHSSLKILIHHWCASQLSCLPSILWRAVVIEHALPSLNAAVLCTAQRGSGNPISYLFHGICLTWVNWWRNNAFRIGMWKSIYSLPQAWSTHCMQGMDMSPLLFWISVWGYLHCSAPYLYMLAASILHLHTVHNLFLQTRSHFHIQM